MEAIVLQALPRPEEERHRRSLALSRVRGCDKLAAATKADESSNTSRAHE